MIGCNYAPVGWAICDGSLLSAADPNNAALLTLLGTTYGGDGVNTFGLPDLRGRSPMHQGNGAVMGQSGGGETVTLTTSQLPLHSHPPLAAANTGGPTTNSPEGKVWSGWIGGSYSAQPPSVPLDPAAIGSVGGSLAHDNMAPFQVVNFIIAIAGIYPSQN